MSEPKLISPMLDNFAMGDPISDQNGIRCCPAMEKDADERYIVKIISTPASQKQLDALLISGAYSSKEAALAYYKELSEGIVEEAEILQKLSLLEGFIPFVKWQIEPMEDEGGYDVYLLSTYRMTLQKYLRNRPMTHLEALNLALDLCASLTVCRRSGYLYVDLKPSNIYITPEKGYRIGDLGFIKLSSLKYASLPERYRSQYTAPEITDAFSSLNASMDIYAVGLILYQVFNNGTLPFTGDTAPCEAFPPPAFADYEIAEIILKACAPDPNDRWQDPVEMGQAIVSYMQRNGAHDTPITPVAEEELPEVTDEDQPGNYETSEEEITKTEEATEKAAEDTTEEVTEETTEEVTEETAEEITQETAEEVTEETTEEIPEEAIYTEDSEGNLTFITDEEDETLPEDGTEISYDEVTSEVSQMLEQVDEIIEHPAPDPVIQPEPVEVTLPEPEEPEKEETAEEAAEKPEAEAAPEESEPETADAPTEEALEDEEEEPRKPSHWLRNLILALLAVGLLVGGYFFYKNYYLQTVDSLSLEADEKGVLTVIVNTSLADDKLSVVCSDTYGHKQTMPVVGGKAVFTELAPNSAYTVKVVANGFHKLIGDTQTAYSTPVQTNVVQFTAVTGSEEGTIILSFAIDGPDAEQWRISYTADGTEFKETTFTGHTLTLNGFTVGTAYTFTLAPDSDQLVTGVTEVTYTASKIIKAERISVTEFSTNKLSATWCAPEGSTVESWTVRCFNENGFDKTIVATEPAASFEITDHTADYTIEVTAAGMSVSQRTFASANALLISNLHVESSNADAVTLAWRFPENSPSDGWKLTYTANGSTPKALSFAGSTATLSPVAPGTTYVFTLTHGEGSAVLGGELTYTVPAAATFSNYGVSPETLEFRMCRRPSYSGWDRWDISDADYRTTYSSGEAAALVIKRNVEYVHTEDMVSVLFVIRDSSGAVVEVSSIPADYWADMWIKGYCYLDIPAIPDAAGDYIVEQYFNGQLATSIQFKVTD